MQIPLYTEGVLSSGFRGKETKAGSSLGLEPTFDGPGARIRTRSLNLTSGQNVRRGMEDILANVMSISTVLPACPALQHLPLDARGPGLLRLWGLRPVGLDTKQHF